MIRSLRLAAAALLATACSGRSTAPAAAGDSAALISDQAHGAGATGFWFLPPMVPQPQLIGAFDAAESPKVEIDELAADRSTVMSPPTATFTTTTGPGSETVRVDTTGQNYIVNWHTDQFPNLDVTHRYRIRVLLGARQLGFADVDLVLSQGQAKNVDTNQYIALVDGKTLPIKFFINLCAPVTCAAQDQCHVAGVCNPSSGACSNPAATDGAGCDDGNGCTSDDQCHAGVCGGTGCGAGDICQGSGAAASCQPSVSLKFMSFPPRAAVVGTTVRYQSVVTLAGGTTFTLSGPAGSSVDDSGLVTWTPTAAQAGDNAFTLSAANGPVSDTQQFVITVAAPAPVSQGSYDPTDPRGATVAVSAPLSPIKGAALVVPQGALDGAAPLTISTVSGLPPPPNLPVGASASAAIEFGPSGATFAQPVRLMLPASADVLAHGAQVLTLDAATGRWVPVQVERVDADNGVVVAQTTHFSPYIVLPDTPVYNLQVDLAGQQTACFGNPVARAPLAQTFAQIPASAVNGWSGPEVSVADVLAALPAGKALQFTTRLDTKLTGTTIERQTYTIASATRQPDGTLSLLVVNDRQPQQFLAIPNHTFTAGDPEVEAWLNGTRVSNSMASAFADISAGLGTGLDVTAEAAFAVVDASLAGTALPRPAVVYGSSHVVKTTAQLAPLNGWDDDCDDAPNAWDPNPNSTPPPDITAAPGGFIHTIVGHPVTVSLSGPTGSTYAFAGSDPTLNLMANADGFSATFTPSARGVFHINGTVTRSGASALWTWSVLVDPPVIVDPPPTASVSASSTSTSVGSQIVLTASGTATRVTPDQLTFQWSASPDNSPLLATSGSTVNFIASAAGDYTVSVIASDGVLQSSAATVTISVAPAGASRPPAPPLVTPLSVHLQHPAGTAAQLSLAASGTAADGGPVMLQYSGAPTSFSVSSVAGGALFSTSTDGSYQLQVTATDTAGNVSPPTSVAILVTPVFPPNPVDADGDGYPAGVGPGFDCDDGDPLTNPGQPPECDGLKDRNCDGVITDANTCDADRDGYTVAQGDCNDHDASIHPNAVELCDGVNNSCSSGGADQGYAGLGQPCSAGVGVCAANGVFTCSADHRSVVCSATPGAPQSETCTGQDDLCDGIINEGCGAASCPSKPNMVSTIVNGGCQYACAAGFWDINHDLSDGCEYACTPTNGGVEICDGLDNNCDGRVDENLSRSTYSGDPSTLGQGICHAGTQLCVSGAWVTVLPEQTPLAESCNGADDNCNGVVDDGFNLMTDPQNCGACGVTCTAQQHCIAAACAQDQAPVIAPLGTASAYEGQSSTVSVTATDAENDALTFTLAAAPSWASIASTGPQSATLTLAPDASSASLPNPFNIDVAADDGHGGVAHAFLTVNVTHPPILNLYEAEGPSDLSTARIDPGGDMAYTIRTGSERRVLVMASAAETTSTTSLSVNCDPGVTVTPIEHTTPTPEIFVPPFASLAQVEYAASAAEEGAVKHCAVESSDGVTDAIRHITFTVGKGLLGESAALPGGMPNFTSPALVDASDGHRYLYVAEQSGLGVYDVTGDVARPRGAYVETPALNLAVGVLGHYAFVVGGVPFFSPQMWVYDISSPLNPTLYAEVTDPAGNGPFTDIAVDTGGQRIAAVTGNVAYIFNLASFLASGDKAALGWTEVQPPDGPNGPGGNALGRSAFVNIGGRDVLLQPEGSAMVMYLVDLGNGAVIGAWQEQHNDNGFGANSVHPFTSPSQPGKQLALLDTGDGLWLEVLDITDPANPAILGAVNDAGYAGAFDGLHWFGGDTFAGFSAVDVTDPTNPVQLGFGQGLDGYQGGTAVSADGTRVYQTEWEHGVTIWHTADLVTPPFDAPPVSQGNRGEMRMVLAVENGVGISTQRHTVSKLDASQFPAVTTGTVDVPDVHSFQGFSSALVTGSLGVTVETYFDDSPNIERTTGLTFRTWDLSGATPAQLGEVQAIDSARSQINNRHVHLVPGMPCVIAGGNGLGIVLVDISNPGTPVAQPIFHPQLDDGTVLRNARISDVGSDGRFLVAGAPLPDGVGSAFFWDFGPNPQCAVTTDGSGNVTYPVFLGHVPESADLFNANGGSVLDAARHVYYSMSGGGSVRIVGFPALAAAAAANQPLDVATQTQIIQLNGRLPAGNGAGSMILSSSTLIIGTDLGPRIFPVNADGTLGDVENIEVNSAHPLFNFSAAGAGPQLYWDTTDPSAPNAFVEQGMIFARKWASCPAANNADCAATTHP